MMMNSQLLNKNRLRFETYKRGIENFEINVGKGVSYQSTTRIGPMN